MQTILIGLMGVKAPLLKESKKEPLVVVPLNHIIYLSKNKKILFIITFRIDNQLWLINFLFHNIIDSILNSM